MNSNPTFGSKATAAGTYKCLILKMTDTVKFTPAATQGTCTLGVEATIDICKASNSVNTSKDALTGATINCLNTLGDVVYVYVSTNSHCADSTEAGCNGTGVSCNLEPPVMSVR